MKKFFINFFLGFVCTAAAFAATDANVSRAIPTKNTNTKVIDTGVRGENTRAKVTEKNETRATGSRNISRATTNTAGDKRAQSNVISRNTNSKKVAARSNASDNVSTVSRSTRAEAVSINNSGVSRRAVNNTRQSGVDVVSRAAVSETTRQSGSKIDGQSRAKQSRIALFGSSNKQKTVTAESLAEAKDVMEKTADLNNTCQEQYNECMDQFCAVVDANQKRCSCSANLSKYAKVQAAVEEANTELNDVAQLIRYVGLSADEIRAIMSETEAEIEISKTQDRSETRSMLEDIEEMIKDPTASTTLNSTSGTDNLLDMDFDFSDDSDSFFNLDFFGSSSTDISSKRGTALYKEATKRCKNVLNKCKDAGATENQITGNYDLAIAKDCVAYEQGLKNLNDSLKNNVRSANLMLQKARLAVLQNKNQYGIRECVGALETCMKDDMVCGDDYLKCLDPTKKYIDENGSVVLGQDISKILAFMQNYDNSAINTDFIKGASMSCESGTGSCIVNYLMTKIGTGKTVKDGGLCRAVLDKCQDFTYTTNGKTSNYQPYNDVVVNYIQRAMVNIKAAQSKIISDYASSCMQDVSDCFSQQTTQIATWSGDADANNVYNVIKGACYNIALTCGHAVFANDESINSNPEKVVSEISKVFAQSLLCPLNSHFDDDASVTAGRVSNNCVCDKDFFANGSSCVSLCPDNKYTRNEDRTCYSTCPKYKQGKTCIDTCDGSIEGDECKGGCSTGTLKYQQTETESVCVTETECANRNYYKSGTRCVAACDSETQLTLTDTTNNIRQCYDISSGCPSGYVQDGTQCVTATACQSSGKYVSADGSECLSECAADEFTVYGTKECVTSCSQHETKKYKFGNVCYASTECPEGTQAYMNECVIKLATDGTHSYVANGRGNRVYIDETEEDQSADEFGLEPGEYKVEFSYGTVKGKTKCSSAGYGGNPVTAGDGGKCWCSMESFLPNVGVGYIAETDKWRYVSDQEYTGGYPQYSGQSEADYCSEECQKLCALSIKTEPDLRMHMYDDANIKYVGGCPGGKVLYGDQCTAVQCSEHNLVEQSGICKSQCDDGFEVYNDGHGICVKSCATGMTYSSITGTCIKTTTDQTHTGNTGGQVQPTTGGSDICEFLGTC